MRQFQFPTTHLRHRLLSPARWLLILVVTGLMAGAGAQPPEEEPPVQPTGGNPDVEYPPEKTTWYTVEVILFRQGGDPESHTERWRRNIDLGYPLDWITLGEPVASEADAGAAEDTTEQPTSPTDPSSGMDKPPMQPVLPDSEQTLQAVTDRLQRSNRYRVLFHEAWNQPFVEEQDPPAIIIATGDEYGEHRELEGTIQLRLKRYLHVDTNLWLTDFATNFGQEREAWPELPWPPHKPRQKEASSLGPLNQNGQDNDNTWTQLQVTSTEYDSLLEQSYIIENIALMQQSRRMRSEELHYIDHPLLGILIQFTPYEPETTPSEVSNDSATD